MGEGGFSLIEMVIAMMVTLVIVGITLDALGLITRTQSRDQAYAREITGTQTALARLIHDLRQAKVVQSVTPNSIRFQIVVGATTWNIAYSCTASDSLGSPYTRCARTQAVAPSLPATPGATAGSLDVVHVRNGATSTFCNSTGTGPSGSVFFVSNAGIANTDGSSLICDEAYENEIASLNSPTFVQVQAQVPASGGLVKGGLAHSTVLESGTFLPNLDAGA